VHHSETIQHLPKIACGTVDVCYRIEAIGHTELSGGARHKLPKTRRSDTAHSQRIVSGFCPDKGVEQTRGENGGAKLDHGGGGEVLLRAA